jgi:hypothetical protein
VPLLRTDNFDKTTAKLWPLSKNKGGNKSKTRRRQRRQSKHNKFQRKNKYSRRRRNAKSK